MFLLAIASGFEEEVLQQITTHTPSSTQKHPGVNSPESEGVNSLESTHGKPRRIRIDNGPEYRSHKLALWAKENAIELRFIQPGKPTQNSYIERFNGTYRTEVLNSFLFDSLQQVWNETEKFQFKYNNQRPHGALMDMPPVEFKKHREAQINGLLQIRSEDNNSKVEFT